MIRISIMVVAIFFALASFSSAIKNTKPNVLFIMVGELRPAPVCCGHSGFYEMIQILGYPDKLFTMQKFFVLKSVDQITDLKL
ncbi:hypothetical protein LXM25_18720 [Dyadobacter sp. LJ53]|uniref:hypothetical protein n=1 Tax=Dyadobacter chenwenxiniae TaxID=2906456 RepID=UPI001F2B5CF6|nr:hypothetical protein [Dyadobacter chenwenxiniae]MCF0052107.1 hypothetical protein [Dyadobacter chenwenxiniae]